MKLSVVMTFFFYARIDDNFCFYERIEVLVWLREANVIFEGMFRSGEILSYLLMPGAQKLLRNFCRTSSEG